MRVLRNVEEEREKKRRRREVNEEKIKTCEEKREYGNVGQR